MESDLRAMERLPIQQTGDVAISETNAVQEPLQKISMT